MILVIILMVSFPRELNIAQVVIHENFNFTGQDNDIAIVKTSKCVVVNKKTKNTPFAGEQVDLLAFPPVCLPSLGQSFAGSDGIVAGENHIIVETLLNCVLGRLGPDRN